MAYALEGHLTADHACHALPLLWAADSGAVVLTFLQGVEEGQGELGMDEDGEEEEERDEAKSEH